MIKPIGIIVSWCRRCGNTEWVSRKSGKGKKCSKCGVIHNQKNVVKVERNREMINVRGYAEYIDGTGYWFTAKAETLVKARNRKLYDLVMENCNDPKFSISYATISKLEVIE